MSKRPFKPQASSSHTEPTAGFGGFGTVFAGSTLSYLSEPPKLSSITDANVVVAFKNLLKKDSTTKTRGLEELRSFVQLHPYEQDGGVEQPLLEAWVKLYPRLSIDNSRRVRELSHILQYELLKSTRKRMEKHIPSVVGAWLSGTYDRDRPVARAANDGITSFLDTDEKLLSLWRKCQPQILAYAREAINETPQTLSDERNISSDDMEAKYDRVMGASISLVINLLIKLDDNYIQKQQEAYDNFLSGNKTLWGFIASNDAFLRKSSAQLLSICLDKQNEIIERDLEILSYAFISEGLLIPQISSSVEFLQALCKLTLKFPSVWTTAYKGKKLPLVKLRQFIERGSQGGPYEYWNVLTSLIKKLPTGVLPTELDGAVSFLKAQRNGIASREEPHANTPAAWNSYLEVVQQLSAGLSDRKYSEQLLRATVFPAFEQFLRPESEQSGWSMGNSTVALVKAFRLSINSERDRNSRSLQEEWWRLTELLTTSMLTSLPEQSKDYNKSQTTVVSESHRWFMLHAEIIRLAELTDTPTSVNQSIRFLADPFSSVVLKALDTISARNGKPYGAAGTLEGALRIVPKLVSTGSSTQDAIASFLKEEFPKLLNSPSSDYLIASMFAFGLLPGQDGTFKEIWKTAVHRLLAAPESPEKRKAICGLISNHSISSTVQEDTQLQRYLIECISKVVQDYLDEWALFESAITFDSLTTETVGYVISSIIPPSLGHNSTLRALEYISTRKPQLLRVRDGSCLAVVTGLLRLTETAIPDTVSRAAALLKSIIENVDPLSTGSGQSSSPVLEIIKENLETADMQSLSVDTLVQQAKIFLLSQRGVLLAKLLPNPVRWSEALLPILEIMPNPELSLTNPLGSAISLIRSPVRQQASQLVRDGYGYSIPFRMALYTSKLLSTGVKLQVLSIEDAVVILRLLTLTLSLASDQAELEEKNRLWISLVEPKTRNQVLEFIDSARKILKAILGDAISWRNDIPDGLSAIIVQKLVNNLIEVSGGTSPMAFYAARALNIIISVLVDVHGWKTLGSDKWLSSLSILKPSTPNIFAAAAIMSGLHEFLATSKVINNLCNRLVSDVTGASVNGEGTLKLLMLLNATLDVFESSNLPVAQHRVVFAAKHITSWMSQEHNLTLPLTTEACKSLQYLLPSIKDIYGPYWEITVKFCVSLWKDKRYNANSNEPLQQLPALNASLRLVTLLKGLKDPNEDLSEALTDLARSISDGLLELLKLPGTDNSLPRLAFHNHLWKQAASIPTNHIPDLSAVYPLIASDSSLKQSAAFLILSRVIPDSQEQISLNVILEKRDAQLPDKLLSLLRDPPSSENFSDEELAKFPSQIRRYLYSWELVFASYPNASYKVRNDYSEILKSKNYSTPLLDFLFDVLGHSVGQPLNLDKASITSENIQLYNDLDAQSSSGERNIPWLLVNIYYLCLKFAPSLAKNWWMDCKSKQTRIAVESWTEKYFSPLVIADTLHEVTTWAANQESGSDDEKELIVKAFKNSREVYAGYEVDDMQMQIVIRLPAAYPLEGVKVDGVNRVAVSEKKWQSWLMVTQGVITFSNGSIIDGLTTFRRNICGALKGQTECAICYSIISSDKKMPDKRCQTCKNLFHSNCLLKWFASSNQSTCPLCRNPFNYGSDIASRARRRGGPE